MLNVNQIKAELGDQVVLIELTGFRGGHFTGHYARLDTACGPGWYVFGRNPAYNGTYTLRTA